MTAEALGKKLRCRCHSVLVGLYRRGLVQRQHQGRANVYLASNARTDEAQRRVLAAPVTAVLPAEIAVMVLAGFIRQPSAGPAELARRVSARATVRIEAEQIRALFAHHGLKKLLPLRPSAS